MNNHGIFRFILSLSILLFPLRAPADILDEVKLPDGFKIEEFAASLDKPRFMAMSPDGVLFVSSMGNGKIIALPDSDKDGSSDKSMTFIDGLNRPNSIAFHDGYLYVGETDKISRLKYGGFNKIPGKKEVFVSGLPNKGHFTKTIGFGADGAMYLSMGSSCNVCVEKDDRRATILRYDPEKKALEVFASGLRNSVGMTWHPGTGELWATDNGRDWLGDNLPPDEVNIIKQGKNYGWPFCYGDKVPDPDFNEPEKCLTTIAPAVKIQAHSAPLGLTFYDGDMFPDDYRGDLFVALHGSWNRSEPTGYKLVRIKMKNGKRQGIEEFARGWLKGEKRLGRPVDVLVGPNGELFVSDDKRGVIYRITSESKN